MADQLQEFEAWKKDYALTAEPNYSVHTEADCRAAFKAGAEWQAALSSSQQVRAEPPFSMSMYASKADYEAAMADCLIHGMGWMSDGKHIPIKDVLQPSSVAMTDEMIKDRPSILDKLSNLTVADEHYDKLEEYVALVFQCARYERHSADWQEAGKKFIIALLQSSPKGASTGTERVLDLYDEIECDLPYLFGRASAEGHEVGQQLAKEVRAKMKLARPALTPPFEFAIKEAYRLAEQGMCHGLLADDYCSQIVALLSPLAASLSSPQEASKPQEKSSLEDLRDMLREELSRASQPSAASGREEWREHWHGSAPYKGWSIVDAKTGRDTIAYIGGDESMSEAMTDLVMAHNAALSAAPADKDAEEPVTDEMIDAACAAVPDLYRVDAMIALEAGLAATAHVVVEEAARYRFLRPRMFIHGRQIQFTVDNWIDDDNAHKTEKNMDAAIDAAIDRMRSEVPK